MKELLKLTKRIKPIEWIGMLAFIYYAVTRGMDARYYDCFMFAGGAVWVYIASITRVLLFMCRDALDELSAAAESFVGRGE